MNKLNVNQLVAQHTSALVRYLRSRGFCTADAEDIAQETWIKVDATIARFDPSRDFIPWLFKIARNTAADHRRFLARRPTVSIDDKDYKAEHHSDESVADPSEQIAIREASDLALMQLPERERLIAQLVADGHSYKEISQKLNIKVNTLKSHLLRMRRFYAG